MIYSDVHAEQIGLVGGGDSADVIAYYYTVGGLQVCCGPDGVAVEEYYKDPSGIVNGEYVGYVEWPVPSNRYFPSTIRLSGTVTRRRGITG